MGKMTKIARKMKVSWNKERAGFETVRVGDRQTGNTPSGEEIQVKVI